MINLFIFDARWWFSLCEKLSLQIELFKRLATCTQESIHRHTVYWFWNKCRAINFKLNKQNDSDTIKTHTLVYFGEIELKIDCKTATAAKMAQHGSDWPIV